MAQVISVRLNRADNSPWGFRLQGGKDFGQPLLIQKVNGGSLAERAGLLVGDAVIRVNNVDVSDMRHKEAQDTIVKAGHNFEVAVQRGSGSTWKPHVSPVGSVPAPGKASPMSTVTKTSLAAAKTPSGAIGSGHNLSPKPFGPSPQVNGDAAVKAIVNKQYNTPVGMYSEETIAETLSAQAEVLAGGAIGVNFMKNEKTYDSQKSEVFKMVQEVDKEPRSPEPETGIAGVNSLRHVPPPEPRVPTTAVTQPTQLPPGQNICADCERLIVGVFVRIKDKNLHVECFKCATCGTSLKNVGYYTINNKLYCDIHAKMVARQNPPAPNFDPIAVPPGGRVPAGTFTAPQISSFPSVAPQSPQPGTLAPLPFHAPRTTISHVNPRLGFQNQTFAPSGPKPFGSTAAPSTPTSVSFAPTPASYAPLPAAPVAPPPAPPSSGLTKPFSEPCTTVTWPPSSSYSQVIKSETSMMSEEKRMSICSQEVCSFSSKKSDLINSIQEEGRCPSPVPMEGETSRQAVEKTIIEAGERILKTRRSVSPQPAGRSISPWPMSVSSVKTPDLLDVSSKPHGIHSLLPPACVMRPLTPQQVVVFPPECPTVMYSRSPTPQPIKQRAPDRCTTCPSPLNAVVPYKPVSPTLQVEDQASINKQVLTKVSKEHSKKEKVKKEHKTEKEHKSDKEHKTKEHKNDKEHKIKEHKAQKSSKSLEAIELTKTERKVENLSAKKEKTSEETSWMEKSFYTKSEVEKLIQEQVTKALIAKEEMSKSHEELEPEPMSVHDLPKPLAPGGWMMNALTTASERPFSPVPFPKAIEIPSAALNVCPKEPLVKKDEKPVPLPSETKPYFPPVPPPPEKEKKDDRVGRALREVGCRSPFTEALTVAPNRSYSPIPSYNTVKPEFKLESAFKPLPGSKKQISMTSALTIAPTVPFTVPGQTPIPEPAPPATGFKPVIFNAPSTTKMEKHTTKSEKSGVCMRLISETGQKQIVRMSPVPIVGPSVKPTPAYIPQPPKPKTETQATKVDSERQEVEILQSKVTSVRPLTPSGLHPPSELPYYQQNIGEIPVRNKSVSPLPHQIRAPEVHPTQMEYKNISTAQQKVQGYKSTTYSETKTYSAQKGSMKPINPQGALKEVLKPERGLSPQSWKAETYRQIQNLSPINVRLSSPRPVSPRTPSGETVQAADAKVLIHRPRPSSPLPPTVKVNVKYPPVTTTGTTIGSEKSAFSKAGKNGGTISSSVHKNASESCQRQCVESDYKTECQKVDKQKQNTRQTTVQAHKEQSSHLSGQSQQISASSQMNVQKEQGYKNAPQILIEQDNGQASVLTDQAVQSSHKEQGNTSYQVNLKEQSQSSSQQMIHKEQFAAHTEQKKSSSQKIESHHTIQASLKSSSLSETASLQNISEVASSQKAIASRGNTSFRAYGETTQKTLEHQGHNTSIKDMISNMSNEKLVSAKTNVVLPDNKNAIKPRASDQSPHPTFPSLPPLSDVDRTTGAGGAGSKTATFAGSSAPKRGRVHDSIVNELSETLTELETLQESTYRVCNICDKKITRGPFITALGKIWCPEHFVCVNAKCGRPLQDIGFVEESDGLYCEFCFEKFLAPSCDKCNSKIKGDCLNAIGKHFHPECFACAYCGKQFGNNPFFLEDSLPYCEADWNELFTTKCFSCGFPIEAGDRWVEALNNNYHSQCFNCTMCKKNLEGQSFYAKAGRPFCKNHAR